MASLSAPEWESILNQVRRCSPNLARPWFDQLGPADLDHGVLAVKCANIPQQRYLGEHCSRVFSEAAQAETGCLVSVRFTLENGADDNGPLAEFRAAPEAIQLSPEYTFDHFVTGPCNRLAHAASVAVSEAPGETYNPLFIHGNVGLGKTHLLHAICHNCAANQPKLRGLYLSCETFINHFIESVERGALHSFRFRYRHVDLLVIDDIQFLAERERSQEEFFHTFNTLYQARKQIILSADCSPREIPSLEDRLVSRFNWGLVARIDKPCLETRMAIVQKKARLRGVTLPEPVIHLIASTIDSNTRELEGAITSIDALSQQNGRPIDLPCAKEALGVDGFQTKSVTIADILDVVMQHYNVKKSALLGKRRTKSIAFPRQVCMCLARELTNHSLEEIGRYFGGRDHTTVIHAVRLMEKLQKENRKLSATLEELKNRVTRS